MVAKLTSAQWRVLNVLRFTGQHVKIGPRTKHEGPLCEVESKATRALVELGLATKQAHRAKITEAGAAYRETKSCQPGRNEAGQYLLTDETERFWSKVDRSGGPDACWPWLTGLDKNGYGKFWMRNGRTVKASRFAVGAIEPGNPKDNVTKHSCDNPPCCNPKHISRGTQAENQAEKAQRNRSLRGTKHPRARISEKTALKIKKLYRTGIRLKDIAIRFNITQGHACQVVFTSWKHLDAQVAHGC